MDIENACMGIFRAQDQLLPPWSNAGYCFTESPSEKALDGRCSARKQA